MSDVKTPWHLWVIGALAVLFDGFGSFDFTATVTKFEPYMGLYPEHYLAYLAAMPLWMLVAWGLAVWSGLIGSVILLLRKSSAVILLGLSALASVSALAIDFLYPPPADMSSPIASVIIILIAGLLAYYAYWAKQNRILC